VVPGRLVPVRAAAVLANPAPKPMQRFGVRERFAVEAAADFVDPPEP